MSEIQNTLCCDQLVLNQSLKTVAFQEQPISLSPTSFELLAQLMQNAPSVVSVDELLEKVWHQKVVNREAVKQQIKSLRDQLGEAAFMVESVRGFGYQIKSEPVSQNQQNLKRQNDLKGRKFWFIYLLIPALIGLAWLVNNQSQPSFSLPLKAAVLPFKLLDSQDQDLIMILQSELTNMMAKQEGVKVIAVSALEHAKYKNYSLKEYVELLNVDVLFEGSVQELVSGYQVNVRMVWARNSVAVWREDIRVEGKDRLKLSVKTSELLENFIQKKVAHLKTKSS